MWRFKTNNEHKDTELQQPDAFGHICKRQIHRNSNKSEKDAKMDLPPCYGNCGDKHAASYIDLQHIQWRWNKIRKYNLFFNQNMVGEDLRHA